MIRLRCLIERGCAHPVLGPILLLVLLLMLAFLFLHFAEDGHGAESFGGLCVALAAIIGSLVVVPSARPSGKPASSGRTDRGPPTLIFASRLQTASGPDPPLSLPLRR